MELQIDKGLGYDPRTQIIKAEFLWTKKCPFSCSFCGMVQNERAAQGEEISEEILQRWYKGIDNLKNIGCEFIAIYGAEPLTRMNGLSEIIKHQRDIGIEQTIITALDKPERIKRLINEGGLNSLSVSYDLKTDDDDRMEKMQNGVKLLEEFPEIDDRACIMTVMKDNQDFVIDGAKEVLDKGYWLLFDLVHPGFEGKDPKTGYNLSKCIGDDYGADVDKVTEIINQFIIWKNEGKKIHASVKLLEDIRDNYIKVNGVVRDLWHCSKQESLGWVSIGSELQVYFCDDYQLEYVKKLDEMETKEDWLEFYYWRQIQSKDCKGCSWNTHYNTNEIIMSGNSGTYVHNKINTDLTKGEK